MSTVGRWARREIDLPAADNPAKFSLEVLNVIDHVVTVEADRLGRRLRILDPCAGVGRIHRLSGAAHRTVAGELEPEWAQQAAPLGPSLVADARHQPYRANSFDALVTSWVYGNRMSDHHEAKDPCNHTVKRKGGEPRVYAQAECPKCKGSGLSERNTYRHKLGRMPTKGSTAVMPFGPGYRHMHHLFYEEALRVVVGDGLLVVNVSNFTRTVGSNGDKREIEERVVEWHLNEMMTLGCNVVSVHPVKTRRNRNGANYDRRVEAERVLVMRAPAKPTGAFTSATTGPYRRTDVVPTGEYL